MVCGIPDNRCSGTMANLKIALITFSATGVTHTYAKTIGERLLDHGCTVQAFDVTAYASRENLISFNNFDGVVFGFPVYSDFAPSVINEWLPKLKGEGTRGATFFTYGGRTTGYAHFHTKVLLQQAGFRLLMSAEFVGRHSFNLAGWRVLPERPNAQDLSMAQEYADLAIARFSIVAPEVLSLQKPFGYNQVSASLGGKQDLSTRQWKHPVRVAGCCMCGICEAECPTGAFDMQTGLSEPTRCISCMHCAYRCPCKAIKVNDNSDFYQQFLSNWHLTDEMLNSKKSKIIAEFWQAAS